MSDKYEINKSRVQQFGLTTTVKDDDGKKHYFYRGHEYVEIGGIKWAVTNVGAEKESDSGLYFAFGETKGYTADQVHRGERKFLSKEYTDVNFDSVKANWGGKWRLPTEAEFQALLSSTTIEWINNYEDSGINGMLFTDTTDWSKKLFFPAAGYCYNGNVLSECSYGFYWSSSVSTISVGNGRNFGFDNEFSTMSYNSCCDGFSVRGLIGD